MIPKFQIKRELGITQWLDNGGIKQHISTLPDGEYEIIIRPKIKWDVDKMRKFLHGPVIDFIIQEFKQKGSVFTKPQIKEWIKTEFGPTQTAGRVSMPMSTSEWSFDTYKGVLQDLNDWCADADTFGCELPAADEVE